jgi:hypothetical protein
MNTEKLEDAAATVIIGQKVLPGLEREYETWQEDTTPLPPNMPGTRRRDLPADTPCNPSGMSYTDSTRQLLTVPRPSRLSAAAHNQRIRL